MKEKVNTTLEQVLIDNIEKANGAVDKGIDFAVEHVPDVVQQLLTWHFVESFLFFTLGLLLVTSAVVIPTNIYKWANKKKPEKKEDVQFPWEWRSYEPKPEVCPEVIIPCGFYSPIAAFFGVVVLLHNLTWLKIWVAPKLYLLEYAASLVK